MPGSLTGKIAWPEDWPQDHGRYLYGAPEIKKSIERNNRIVGLQNNPACHKYILVEERAAIIGIISLELQRGAAGETELKFLDRFFTAIHYVLTKEESYKNAGLMGYNLSKKGINIGTVDLLIAQTAIENNIPLYTLDRHFKEIAVHFPLLLFA